MLRISNDMIEDPGTKQKLSDKLAAVDSLIGNVTTLTTNAKTSVVAAINENVSSLADKAQQTDLQSETSNRQAKDTDLQTQVNNLVLGAVGSGNNAEVVQARANYSLLNDRFTGNETKLGAFDSAVSDGLANYTYSGNMTSNTGLANATTSATSYSNAYENGFVAPDAITITSITLNANITSTSFYIYTFDSSLNLLQTVYLPSPTITNQTFNVGTPIALPKGGKIYIRFNNGTYYYNRHATSDLHEYRATSVPPVMAVSPVQAGFDVSYSFTTIKFSGSQAMYESLVSSVSVGLATASSLSDTVSTSYSYSSYTNNLSNPGKGYNNGFSAPYSLMLKSVTIQVHPTTPCTSLGVYVYDSQNNFISHASGVVVSNGVATPTNPIFVKKGYTVFINFENGNFYYLNSGTSDKKELTITGLTVASSPILAAFNLTYSKCSFTFQQPSTSNTDSLVKLTDYVLPKYKNISDPIGYVGRWFPQTINGTVYNTTLNAGSEFYFKVKGATLITLGWTQMGDLSYQEPYFAYSIDGGSFTRQGISSKTIAVDTNEHIIRIVCDGLTPQGWKWNDKIGFAISGVTVDAGTITGVLPRNRIGMYFGDSITEGVVILGSTSNSADNTATSSYAFIASQNLNAITMNVGFGGSGITVSGTGNTCINVIDSIANGVPVGDYYPDFIVLNHGTNDTAADSPTFISGYNAVLNRLKIKYPGVPIFCMTPMTTQTHAADIASCVSGKLWCYLVDTSSWGIPQVNGVHPDAAGDLKAGQNLASQIKAVLGKQFFMI